MPSATAEPQRLDWHIPTRLLHPDTAPQFTPHAGSHAAAVALSKQRSAAPTADEKVSDSREPAFSIRTGHAAKRPPRPPLAARQQLGSRQRQQQRRREHRIRCSEATERAWAGPCRTPLLPWSVESRALIIVPVIAAYNFSHETQWKMHPRSKTLVLCAMGERSVESPRDVMC